MNEHQTAAAHAALEAAETGSLTFPRIVGSLIDAGFERYAVDFCRNTHIYYLPDGDSVMFEIPSRHVAIGAGFDVDAVKAAIREAQQDAPGYTYPGFCENVMRAGCVGYVVSFPGRRAVYSARTGEAHVEHFPD